MPHQIQANETKTPLRCVTKVKPNKKYTVFLTIKKYNYQNVKKCKIHCTKR